MKAGSFRRDLEPLFRASVGWAKSKMADAMLPTAQNAEERQGDKLSYAAVTRSSHPGTPVSTIKPAALTPAFTEPITTPSLEELQHMSMGPTSPNTGTGQVIADIPSHTLLSAPDLF